MTVRYWFRIADGDYIISYDDDMSWAGYVEAPAERPTGYYVIVDANNPQWVVEPEKAKKYFAERRLQAEEAGISFGGRNFATARTDRVALLDLVVRAMRDDTLAVNFKGANGDWFNITGAELIDAHTAIHSYVQECFAREKALVDLLAAGGIEPHTAEQGWPNQERSA